MKLSPAFCLVVMSITLFAQFGTCYPIGDRQGGEELMVDNGGTEQANGSFVNITEDGPMNVVLEGNGFGFELCSKKCDGEVLVCYEGDNPSQSASDLCDSKCGFFIAGKNNTISVTSSASGHKGKTMEDWCDSITTVRGKMFFRGDSFTRCAPKVVNGMVKLNVSIASSSCPLVIKNAHLVPEATTSPLTTPTPKSANLDKTSTTKSGASGANNGTTTDSPTFMASYWWVFLIVGIIILAGIAIGLLVYCFVFKKEKKPTIVSPAVERRLKRPKTKIVAPPAAEEEPKEDGKRSKLPSSILDPSSILSQKSLLDINRKEPQQQLEPKKEEAQQPSVQPSTDLKSVV